MSRPHWIISVILAAFEMIGVLSFVILIMTAVWLNTSPDNKIIIEGKQS